MVRRGAKSGGRDSLKLAVSSNIDEGEAVCTAYFHLNKRFSADDQPQLGGMIREELLATADDLTAEANNNL